MAVHVPEHPVTGVLQRNVDVMTDFRFFGHDPDQLVRDVILVGVHDADPFDAVDPAKLLQESGQHRAAFDVLPVITGVLCDQDQFFRSSLCQAVRLPEDARLRPAAVISPDVRNDAVGTPVVTAFRNSQIRCVRILRQFPVLFLRFESLSIIFSHGAEPFPGLFQFIQQPREFFIIIHTQKSVRFRNFLE